MSAEYNAVQESIKIALDAADAATDVTSEFNKVKRDNKKLEASVKNVHRYTVIIFASSMLAAVAALLFAGLIYFRTMSELDTMTTTSREALVLFAENVEGVNESLENMKDALQTQRKVAGQNETLINELVGLRFLSKCDRAVNSFLSINRDGVKVRTRIVPTDICQKLWDCRRIYDVCVINGGVRPKLPPSYAVVIDYFKNCLSYRQI